MIKTHWENYQTLFIYLETNKKNKMVFLCASSKLVWTRSLYTYSQILVEDSKIHLFRQISLKLWGKKSRACQTGNIIIEPEILWYKANRSRLTEMQFEEKRKMKFNISAGVSISWSRSSSSQWDPEPRRTSNLEAAGTKTRSWLWDNHLEFPPPPTEFAFRIQPERTPC